MATRINYSPLNHPPVGYIENNERDDIWDHPLHNEGVFIPPRRALEYEQERHENRSYQECPAWKSYWAQSFVVFNQIDLKMTFKKESGLITDTNFPLHEFNKYVLINEGSTRGFNSEQIDSPYRGNLVFQLSQSMFMWTDKKLRNIWVELSPWPSLYHDTGLEFINAEFPFSRWHRPVNAAFKAHAPNIDLKRGQPLYVMRFRGGKNNAYDLRRWKDFGGPPDTLKRRLNQHQSLKQWVKGVSWGLINKDEPQKKCPFNPFR